MEAFEQPRYGFHRYAHAGVADAEFGPRRAESATSPSRL